MIGFIGFGNMATAITKGLINKDADINNKIYIYDVDKTKLQNAYKTFKVNICADYSDLFKKCKYIFLAVKPNVYKDIYKIIKENYSDNTILISMAAGVTIDEINKNTNCNKIVRIMPNVVALINEGVTAATFLNICEDERKEIINILNAIGKVVEMDEKDINKYSVLCGSGPAFVAEFIEALVDAGVYIGVPYKEALNAICDTIIGTTKMLQNNGINTCDLKYMVCSPGGTTIEGIRTLQNEGFKSAVIEAVINTYNKNCNLR
ncbi:MULTISPECIES: pyrroline-5-carboxylate reductase [Caloramator]|uniref:Pyrroline-5-carboxylate reductase n=1 Tax=Caloramator proteoclasticus DSM 10124 TaxID=1121262 RepID=A0A1M4SQ66_9CLOT|nr:MULTISPECIES: pyrroline-5-carboxylate reductase [Caloramator]SHE34315.1 pyrroline-5-carboxylate reductase [Caloramator proteoclasticus DSM 10124]